MGPTDIEIVYTNPANLSTLQAYITDTRNGCVRRYTTDNKGSMLETYLPDVFGVCGAARDPLTWAPTYLAADASSNAAFPSLYVAYTELKSIKWHNPENSNAGSLSAADSNGR